MEKYVDIPAIVQVIGGIYNNPTLLDETDKYTFNEEDFPEEFHKILFGSIYNLYLLGAKEISIVSIEDYLTQRPNSFAIYKMYKGADYLQQLSQTTQLAAFDYYYGRMKKMTLLRMYNKIGLNLTWLYDVDNILDNKKKQAQEEWLDNTSIEDIANLIDKRITDIHLKYVDNSDNNLLNAGDGAKELLEQFQKTPELGYPLYGTYINTITRGARLKKFYLRSAATGVGKTRSMIADVCSIACDRRFDSAQQKWINTGTREPAMFISTEQEIDEIQTMIIAFISDVDEEHIINGQYFENEWERVIEAVNILNKSPLYIQQLPDFSLKDIENAIKQGIHNYGIKYVFFDYIHSSMKILGEISSKAGVKNLREDNILFMISIRLKDLCNQYGIFIMTATQLNSDYRSADIYDQNLLRGAKSIADKIDLGMIMLEVNQKDLDALEPIIKKGGFFTPVIKISIYKNRRGKYKNLLLWCSENRGTCKINPMFVTTYNYELISIEDLQIVIKPKIESSAF